MILSDRDIKRQIEQGRIKVDPAPDFSTQLGSTGLDFRLSSKFRVFKPTSIPYIDPQDNSTLEMHTTVIDVSEEDDKQPLLPHLPDGPRAFVIHPGEFVLGVTVESIELPDDIAGRLEGRSSLGRLGIVVHSTAGHFDAGWSGNIVLEISNLGVIPVLLYPGMRFCQMVFETLTSPAEVLYKEKKANKYAGQSDPKSSALSKEKEEIRKGTKG
jgi:dCTP deaminase